MELVEWIQTTMVSRLIIRMELTNYTHKPGWEGVRASLVNCVQTESGKMMAHVTFDRLMGAAIGNILIKIEGDPALFPNLIKYGVLVNWNQIPGGSWEVRSDKLFQLKTARDGGIRCHDLHASNVLVGQHLGRIQGAIGQANKGFDDDQAHVLATMAAVLGTIIADSNGELVRLTGVTY